MLIFFEHNQDRFLPDLLNLNLKKENFTYFFHSHGQTAFKCSPKKGLD